MIDILTAFALAVLADASDVERLRQSAPTFLNSTTAREHLGAARAAAIKYNVRPELLLGIASRESGYGAKLTYREASGLYSCGVGQVTNLNGGACEPYTLTVTGGYLESARVLNAFAMACKGDEHCALTGYAGGFYLISFCRKNAHVNCGISNGLMARAARIRGW
jgi:hypothetical protein